MKISVIIPHLNDDGLEACLTSLTAQVGFDGDVEIIVVDNGSKHPPLGLCARFVQVRLLVEERPGPGHARNCGVEAATGDLLAFTDADCKVAPDWLAQISQGMEDQSVTILGGLIEVVYDDSNSPRFTEPYERVYSFRNSKHIAEGYSASANMAVRKSVFKHVGGFGGREIAEDQEWGQRASRSGFRPVFREELRVQNAPRADFKALSRKWDRHIAHDYNASGVSARWVLRALSLPFSPLLEIRTVARTPKLDGVKERLLCFACLSRVRFYRGVKMLMVASGGQGEIHWNDQET